MRDVLAALNGARTITFLAYTLGPGRVEEALAAASRRGASVSVRLEGQPYADPGGSLLAENRATIATLQRAGVDARLVHERGSNDPPLHTKAICTDRACFLDDCNWSSDAAGTIVRCVSDSSDEPAMQKRDALALEARLLAHARAGDDVILETESCGGENPVYAALDALGKAGVSPRVLVSARDLKNNPRERAALVRLIRDGVRVRTCDADEKFALARTEGWLGSANATAAFARPDQLDWGARTADPTIVAHLRERFDARWRAAAPLA
jgi:hypothetical protein